jgi:universal stress protein A
MPREFKTILCPTDFSEGSKAAAAYALWFANLSGATIVLAHSIHVATERLKNEEGHILSIDQIKEKAHAELRALCDGVLGGYPRCELEVEIGDPAEHLIEVAKRRNVDLIVTAMRDHSGVPQLLTSSVSEKLLRLAPCPVFVVRHGVA